MGHWSKMWDLVTGEDTPYTVRTTRAPAVLTIGTHFLMVSLCGAVRRSTYMLTYFSSQRNPATVRMLVIASMAS